MIIEEKKQQLLDFFKNLDPSFFKNFKVLLETILQTKSIECTEEEIVNEITDNQNVDPNIIISDCCDFFSSINPQYGEMARNIIRNPQQLKFRCLSKPQRELNSHQNRVDINQNWHDVCILSHEVTHGFVIPTNYGDREKQFNLITELLMEVPSITVELLTKDFLLEKRNIEVNFLVKLRMFNLSNIYQKLYDENGRVVEGLQGVIDFIQDNSNVNPELESLINNHILDDFEFFMMIFLSSFVYVIGVLIASYIYQKIKEDPQNIHLFDDMLTVLAKGFTYPEECIQLLERIGIPIVNDGKFSLTEENIAILCDNYFKTFGGQYSSISRVS